MPALPPLPNGVKLDFFYSLVGGTFPAHNILHGLLSGPVTQEDVNDVSQDAFTTWKSTLQGFITTDAQLNFVTCTAIDGTDLTAVSTPVPAVGTGSTPTLPPQCAVCLSWKIGASYRGGKPRMYLPFVSQSSLVKPGGAQLTSGSANSYATAGTNFLAQMNAIALGSGKTFTLGCVSYRTGGAVRPTPLFRAYQSCVVHERLDSQRRRSGKESAYPTV